MRVRIRAALRFPVAGGEWPRKILLGGATGLVLEAFFLGFTHLASGEAAFNVAPLAVFLNLPLLGYALSVYGGTLRWEVAAPPEWADWGRLVRIGLVGFLVALAYEVIPLVLLLFGLGLLVKGGILLFFGMVLMVLGVLAGVFSLFFLPMGLARYLLQKRLEAAFHPGVLWDGINAVLPEYVATYLLCVGLSILAGLVAAVPYVGGLLVWPFLWFYLLLVQARLFGEVCAKVA
jgi:hypothetical protein